MKNIDWQPIEGLCLSPKDSTDAGEYIAITAVNEIGRRHSFNIWVQKIETPFERPGVYYDHSCRNKVSNKQIRKWIAFAPLGIEPEQQAIRPFVGTIE